MRLERVLGTGFRNLADFDLELDPTFTVFHGPNAQGKTNTLEAIWVLSSLKPLRGHRNRDLVRWEGSRTELAGFSVHREVRTHRRLAFEKGTRTLSVDGNRASLTDWFEGLRAIAFRPSDVEIVLGGPEFRRRWVDRAAFTVRPAHLDLVRTHQRVLANKGAALRGPKPDPVLLDTFDHQLAHVGGELAQRRVELLESLTQHVCRTVQMLSGRQVQVGMRLRTVADGQDLATRRSVLAHALRASRSNELRRRRTLTGVQMDDVVLELQGQSARNFASQGQVRTLVLGLKLGELLAARDRDEVPLFLLDDLSSELDGARTGRLIGLLGDLGAQVIATTTDPSHIARATQTRPLEIAVQAGRLG